MAKKVTASSFVLDGLLADRTFHELIQIVADATLVELIVSAIQHNMLIFLEFLLISVEKLRMVVFFELLDADRAKFTLL